jgi:hypothetical protein
MRSSRFLAPIFVSAALALSACGAQSPADDASVSAESALSDAKAVAGAYQFTQATESEDLAALVLRADGTYLAELFSGGAAVRETGTFTYRASSRRLALTPVSGARRSYRVTDRTATTISLRSASDTSNVQDFAQVASYCDQTSDCVGQSIRPNVAMCMVGSAPAPACAANLCVSSCTPIACNVGDGTCPAGSFCKGSCDTGAPGVHCNNTAGVCTPSPAPSLGCRVNADCPASFVCEPYCPVLPTGLHCEIAGNHCVAAPSCAWGPGDEETDTISTHEYASTDTLVKYHFAADGTFWSSSAPACTIAQPIHCMIAVMQNTGVFVIPDNKSVELTYDNGDTATLAIQADCNNNERITGTDYGTTVTVFPSVK